MQLSLTARAIFSGARRRRRGAKGYARAKSGGGRASCISRELGCNNYYLSRPFAHPLSSAHHYISSHHSMSVDWNGVPEQHHRIAAAAAAIAALCFANRIDFRNLSRGRFSLCPLVHGRPSTRTAVYRYRSSTYIYAYHIYIYIYIHVRLWLRPRIINFLQIINQHGNARLAPRV